MFQKNVSGQYLYFSLVSAISGNVVTGASGSISGCRSLDGLSGMIVLSGNIVELGNGFYRANLYDFDTNGNNAGYLFTASGCVPASYSVVTLGGVSGALFSASGQAVSVNSGQLSGQIINLMSGISFIASGQSAVASLISGQSVSVWSGTQVNLFSGQLSGQPITLLSGFSFIASGINTTPIGTIGSGLLYLASGSIFINTFASGAIGGGSGNIPSAWGNSGATTVGQNLDKTGYTASTVTDKTGYSLTSGTTSLVSGQSVSLNSGQLVLIASGQISGQLINLLSGNSVSVWSGTQVNLFSGQLSGQPITLLSGFSYPASGVFTTAAVTINSGTLYLASGQAVSLNSGQIILIASGQLVNLFSGNSVSVWSGAQVNLFSGQLSGQPIAGLSGFIYPASGVNAVAPVASGSLSGQPITLLSGFSYTASGLFAVATANVASGSLYLASGSIFINTFASGAIGGGSGNIPSTWGNSGAVSVGQNLDKTGYSVASGQLSGQLVTLVSGQSYTASGIFAVATASIASGALSGQFISVFSGSLSGQPIAGLSGFVYPASGVNTTASVTSGSLYLASGSILMTTFASGVVGGGSGNIPSAWGGSGAVVVALNLDKTGYSLTSGTTSLVSGQSVNLLSGNIVSLYSGQQTIPASGQLSGQAITLLSGFSYPASGVNVVVPAVSVLSGSTFLASGSIFLNSFASGLIGGGSGNLPSSWGGSGGVVASVVRDKSGYVLSSGGLDAITIETGMNMRQSQSIALAALGGRLSGAGTLSVLIDGANASGTNRITGIVDQSGNRTAITLNLPT